MKKELPVLGVKKFEVSTIGPQLSGRKCGQCQMCCVIPDIKELNKPANTPCQHLTPRGCGIYETRPEVCRSFECNWKFGLGDASGRPDRLGFYTTNCREFRDDHIDGLRIHTHPGKADIWEKSAAWVRRVYNLLEAGGTVFIIAGDDRRVITKDPRVLAVLNELKEAE